MVPRANAYLATSFFMPEVKESRTFLFPPILRKGILQAKPIAGEHVLVYVTSPAPALTKLLSGVRGSFVAYGFGREGREGNILFKKPSLGGFLQDLTACKAIIANAGFSLVTEALHLAKPYLAIPVKHQFEQIFNAYWLDKMGYGAYWEDLNKERVESFLYNVPHYIEKLATYPRHGNQALLEKMSAYISIVRNEAELPYPPEAMLSVMEEYYLCESLDGLTKHWWHASAEIFRASAKFNHRNRFGD